MQGTGAGAEQMLSQNASDCDGTAGAECSYADELFDGDFYSAGALNYGVRLALQSATSGFQEDQVWCGMLEEEQHITRGAAICSERPRMREEDLCQPIAGFESHRFLPCEGELSSMPFGGSGDLFADLAAMPGSLPGFCGSCVPPPVPQHAFFVHAATTVRLQLPSGGEPHKIGNTLLRFFEEAVQATLVKVRPVKFWVSADVGIDGTTVRVKARTYSAGDGSYLLEVQRRHGCTVIFSRIYKEVQLFFTARGFSVQATLADPALPGCLAELGGSPLTVGLQRPACC